MRIDVRETENSYELDVDLPGYRKEDIKVQLKDGNLTIYASKNTEKEEKDKNGKYVRRERYTGNMSRSFHVGNTITETDIHAKFEDGILKLSLPKPSQKAVEHKGYIAIEGQFPLTFRVAAYTCSSPYFFALSFPIRRSDTANPASSASLRTRSAATQTTVSS